MMIKLEHVGKEFTSKEKNIKAVQDVNLEIVKGEIFGIIGFSGAGKSTLIRCMNLLERPTTGKVYVDHQDMMALNNKELRRARQKIGMIFQQFNLFEQSTVISNVCYPLEIAGMAKNEAKKRGKELLELVGLSDKEEAFPSQLSGGQKQRVAIARALATNPKVLLCDEATSALDPITTCSILELIKSINKNFGVTIVMITHELRVIEQICDRVAVMSEGMIQEIGKVKDVFLNPKSKAAKNLILSGEVDYSILSNKRVLKVNFNKNKELILKRG